MSYFSALKAIARRLCYEAIREDVIDLDDAKWLAGMALDALRANGYEVVKLPEPEDRESKHEIATCWDHLPHQILVWDSHPDEVQWAYNFEPGEPLTPTEALELAGSLAAAALLAAANAVGDPTLPRCRTDCLLVAKNAMSDPAADAAQLALVRIRELHAKNTEPCADCSKLCSVCASECVTCETPWPCDTARLCYTTDELKPKGIQ